MINQYRKLKQAEVYLVCSDNNQILALLFVESIFLDNRTLTGTLILLNLPFSASLINDQFLYQVGTVLYDFKVDFEQLILQVPDRSRKAAAGREPAIFLGDSVYPNRFQTKRFAASDFDSVSYLIFPFHKHNIVVHIKSNQIIQVQFIQPQQIVTDKNLRKALTKQELLTDAGIIKSENKILQILSQREPITPQLKEKTMQQFTDYFSGKLTEFDLPYVVQTGTVFQRKVWQILSQIPYGAVFSYEEVAERLLDKPDKAYAYARAVGSACGSNPLGILIPCHRVIGKDKSLTGFGGGVKLKGHLLDLEFIGRSRNRK
ncbi:MAG TPA: methylated-DNA--[protein]-cysteine S-methyltransferase [Clostridiaceae bacterium]|nr:methylated-DNA--[protein]-cysteine S-methyltransferase [Clostridiaceae bacterium]